MDTTVKWICPSCKNEDMNGHGANLGDRIMTWGKKCPKCGLELSIVHI